MKTEIDFATIIPKFDKILSRGLCKGMGDPDNQVCIEAAICLAMGLPFGDDPPCVAEAVKVFKRAINDKHWSTPEARAKALRNIGIAQIGSAGVISNALFTKKLAEKTIRVLIPRLFRNYFNQYPVLMAAADLCEENGDYDSVIKLKDAAAGIANAHAAAARYPAIYAAANIALYTADAILAAAAADAADAAAAAIYSANAVNIVSAAVAAVAAVAAANAAAYAARAADAVDVAPDEFLILSVDLALEVLIELKSPGCEWI